ncbi:hypothetical protein RINTHM_10530 [Richelia intracellularis HM01]|nr:hypothetical protein RINTHM_10530 [Richelia intracellularis HM01]
MKTQYQFQIKKENVRGKPVITWIPPFGTFECNTWVVRS